MSDVRANGDRSITGLAQALKEGTPREASLSCAAILTLFEPVFRKYWRRIVPHLPAATMEYSDFVQEIALRLVRSKDRVSNLHAFPGYVQATVASTASDCLRQARRDDRRNYKPDPAELVARDFLNDIIDTLMVRSFMARLRPKHRLALELSIVQELDAAECSLQLTLSESGFRTLKARALEQLGDIVRAECDLITKP